MAMLDFKRSNIMANFIENYGLEELTSDKLIKNFICDIVANGKAISTYSGLPYVYKDFGDPEFYLATENAEDGKLAISKFNAHCGGDCLWELYAKGIRLDEGNQMKNYCGIFQSEKGGMLAIDVITADVLPSYLDGDKVKMQVIAFPLKINYYKDENDYREAQPMGEDGKIWLVEMGTLMPISFLCNHSTDNYEKGKAYEDDMYLNFTAKVTALGIGAFEREDKKFNTFIRCRVSTKYGDLEFNHTVEQVDEDMRNNIAVGSIISGVCVLSGDVAIDEYENGIIKNFDNNLRLLRYTFEEGLAERLGAILTENTVFETDNSDKTYYGTKEIIERFKYVNEHRKGEYQTFLATVSEADGDLDYPAGTRCVVLKDRGESGYESIAFIELDENENLSKIKISTDSRYCFNIDEDSENLDFIDEVPNEDEPQKS